MLFDAATANYKLSPKTIPELKVKRLIRETVIVSDFWEEHCVECGAPHCYATCEKFCKANDGRCRRFTQGILPVMDGSGNSAVAIQFLPWGKLELFFRGRMVVPDVAIHIAAVQKRMVALTRVLNRFFMWLPYSRNPIAIWRSIRRHWVSRQSSVCQSPTYWIIQTVVEKPVELAASIVNEKGEEVFVRRLEMRSGANAFIFEVPVVGRGSCFKLFSVAGTDVPVYFTQLELACGTRTLQMSARPAKFIKCVAWDLDNTLWNGILAEDGSDGVVLRKEAVDLIKRLDARGILNTICSKNDWEPVKEQLQKFGLLEYFVFPEVNWGPKSESLHRAAKNINIGLDTFAFIDDSEYERGEVAANCPMVRVYSEQSIDEISGEPCFNPEVTKESAKRRFSYLAEMQRHRAESHAAGSRLDFLRDCKIQLTCGQLVNRDLKKRCWELVNRTNQLTLAARRYTDEEFELLLGNGESYAVHCKDKYGDYGIVGFIAIANHGHQAIVREFVMSCRVAKKLCEQSVLLFMADRYREHGNEELCAEVKETGRNKALIEAFDAMPFKKETQEESRYIYRLKLNNNNWNNVYRNAVCVGDVKI